MKLPLIAIAALGALSVPVRAEAVTVKMMNRSKKGSTMFAPDILHVKAGERVKFIATRKSHNAATIDRTVPERHPGFKGKINGEIGVTVNRNGTSAASSARLIMGWAR